MLRQQLKTKLGVENQSQKSMKKNLTIIFLSIITVVSLIFAYSQMQKAEKQKALAEEHYEALKEKEREDKIALELATELAKKYSKIAKEEAEKMRREAELAQKE